MSEYLGDFAEDAEVVFCWNTNDGDGGSVTRATDGTVKVRRDDGTDCTGTSVTDNEDTPDTGIHECKVDTSDNANYATGHDYIVWLDGAVIDGQTVNAALAQFSIESRFTEVDVTKWLGTAAATPTVAGVPEVDVTHLGGVQQSATDLKDFADTGYDPSEHKVEGVVLADTVTTLTGHTAQTGDVYAALPTNFADLSITSTTGRVDVASVEGSDATDQIRDAVVDDATRIDASALNTLSGHDPGANLGTSTLTQTEVTGGAYALDTDANGRVRIVDGTGTGELDTASGKVDVNDKTGFSLVADQSGVTVGTVTDVTNAVTTDAASRAASKADVSGLSTLTAAQVNAEADTALSDYDGPTNAEVAAMFTEIKGSGWVAATDTLEKIRDAVALTAAGAGADQVTLTLLDDGNDPVADARVWVSTDSAGQDVIAGVLTTDTSGQVPFMLDAGTTYYRWAVKDGVNFTNPSSFVAVAD